MQKEIENIVNKIVAQERDFLVGWVLKKLELQRSTILDLIDANIDLHLSKHRCVHPLEVREMMDTFREEMSQVLHEALEAPITQHPTPLEKAMLDADARIEGRHHVHCPRCNYVQVLNNKFEPIFDGTDAS